MSQLYEAAALPIRSGGSDDQKDPKMKAFVEKMRMAQQDAKSYNKMMAMENQYTRDSHIKDGKTAPGFLGPFRTSGTKSGEWTNLLGETGRPKIKPKPGLKRNSPSRKEGL